MKKVLLVEDSEIEARILIAVLSKAGYATVRAKDGQEGYDLIRSMAQLPDLLITDVLMPRMSGFELLARLSADRKLPPTIVLTGKQNEEDVLRGLNYGALDYVAKPFSPSIILARVKLALERSATSAGAA